MKTSNAGAILLLGAGVLLLNLAYTGRAAAVWAALLGRESADVPANASEPPADGEGADGGGTDSGDTTGTDGKPTSPGSEIVTGRKPTDAGGAGSAWRSVRIN
jgi:hypothetical protein